MAANNEPISIWTAADEARLVELQRRKNRIMEEKLAPLEEKIQGCFGKYLDGTVADLIAVEMANAAETFRDLLAPFDGRKP